MQRLETLDMNRTRGAREHNKRCLPGIAMVLALFVSAAHAKADAGRAAALSWVRLPGAERCSSEAEIAAQVAERLQRDPWVSPTHAQLFLDAVIYPDGPQRYRARVQVRDEASGESGTRELATRDADCRAIDAEISLTLALMVDPDAVLHEATPLPGREIVPETRVETRSPVPDAQPRAPEIFSFSAAAALGVGFRHLPSPGASLRFAWHAIPALSAELGATLLTSGVGGEAGTRGVSLHAYFADPAVCGPHLGSARVWLRGCIGVQLGAIESEGVGFIHSLHHFSTWVAPEVALRFRATFTRTIGLEFAATLSVPAVQTTYSGVYADGSTSTLYQTPSVTGFFEIALFSVDGP